MTSRAHFLRAVRGKKTPSAANPATSVPVNTSLPTIMGTQQQGQLVSATTGTWQNSPTSFAFQWIRDNASIPGETASGYTVTAADVGKVLRVSVVATNAEGQSEPAFSIGVGVVLPLPPAITVIPTISGTVGTGNVLTCGDGTWANGTTSIAKQWLRNGSEILGETGGTYSCVAADVGQAITVRLVATNSGGASDPVVTAPAEQSPVLTPTNATVPIISGTARQGQTLTCTLGTWNNNPTSFSIQWKRTISGVTSDVGSNQNSYPLTASDVGATIAVSVTASNSGGTSAPAASVATSAVLPLAPTNTALPTISGTTTQGFTLTGSDGSWTGSPSFTRQWKRGGVNISGATGSTYVLQAADVGQTLTFEVTGTNAGGSNTAASAATATIQSSSTTGEPGTTVPAGYTVILAPAPTGSDQRAALQSLIDSAPPFSCLKLQTGRYKCSGNNRSDNLRAMLTAVGKDDFAVIGNGKSNTFIEPLDNTQSSFIFSGCDRLTVGGFVVDGQYTASKRETLPQYRAFSFIVCRDITVNGCRANHVAAAGFFFHQVRATSSNNPCMIINNHAWQTRADYFHCSYASHHLTFQYNLVQGWGTGVLKGDDSFASIGIGSTSANPDGKPNLNIKFLDNRAEDNGWAGGIHFEGTTGGEARRNEIYRMGISGLSLSSQSGWNAGPVDDIYCEDNYLEGCVTRTQTGHGSIMNYTNWQDVGSTTAKIQILRTTIRNPASGPGIRSFGNAAAVAWVRSTIRDTQMFGLNTPYSTGANATLVKSGTTLDGNAVSGG